MNHKDKIKLAKKMRSRQELINRVSIWDTRAWIDRKNARAGIKPHKWIEVPPVVKLSWWKRLISWLKRK